MTPECVWAIEAELGEGPLWVPAEQALWFVDIKGHQIHRFHPATAGRTTYSTPESPGFIVPGEDGDFTVGMSSGIYAFDPKTGAFALLHRVDAHHPGNRLNDGTRDPKGRLWFGTMDNGESQPTEASTGSTRMGPQPWIAASVSPTGPASVRTAGRSIIPTR